MQESGIDLDFDINSLDIFNDDKSQVYKSAEEELKPKLDVDIFLKDFEGKTYELQSQVVESVSASTASPLSTTMSTRTSFKQELQRRQLYEEEKNRKDVPSNGANPKTNAIDLPKANNLNTIPEVPRAVLQVSTQLQNPTRYFIQQTQKKQVAEYLSTSQQGQNMSPHMHQSPVTNSPSRLPNGSQTSSLPSSPMSTAEVDFLTDDFDTTDEALLRLLQEASIHMPSTMPTVSQGFLDPSTPPSGNMPVAVAQQSMSCPSTIKQEPITLTEEQLRAYAKDRQKKDNHNMIERRRRFNINDRIKELGTLIPKSPDPDQRQNKGSILKMSVDYIRKLQREREQHMKAEEKHRQLGSLCRRMLLRLQELEMVCKKHNLDVNPYSLETNTDALATQLISLNGQNLDMSMKVDAPQESPMQTMGGFGPRNQSATLVNPNNQLPNQNSVLNHNSLTGNSSSMLDDMIEDSSSPVVSDALLWHNSPMASHHSSRRSSITSMEDLLS
ncbi:transcription factor EC-like isoform X1 [Apostichopus japonicus]|uniref:transcription factor EC-like isoform X1 n=1 Tax=Stichopus japonicus TaxID=307972 RepID=UPI003AB12C16